MQFIFSTSFEDATLHIRNSQNYVQRLPLLNEMPHRHFFIEFHYVYKGKEKIVFPKLEKEIMLTEGQIALIPRSVYHKAETSPDEEVERLCFDFSIDAEKKSANEIFKIYESITEYSVVSNDNVRALLERCKDVISDDASPLDHTLEGVILLDAVLEVFRTLYNEKKPTQKRQLNKQRQKWLIEEYISNFHHFPDGLSGLAEQLYLSERQTRRIVKQFFGEEYKTLIIKQRMETAQILLKTSKLTLDEIAEKIGYKSYSGFHMAFVKAVGTTPGEYRKNI